LQPLLEKLFVERMDQNEEIFVRFMNDAPLASQAYRRLRAAAPGSIAGAGPLPNED
jgi:type I restriction enzyme R subunit